MLRDGRPLITKVSDFATFLTTKNWMKTFDCIARHYASAGYTLSYQTDRSRHSSEFDSSWKTPYRRPSRARTAIPPTPVWKPDPEIGLKWLQKCMTEHQSHCGARTKWTKVSTGGPVWLIDTSEDKIVAAEDGAEYAALSYVWGPRNNLRLTKDNIENLGRKGALSGAPKTIRQAISFAYSALRMQYLWVDSLCIIQDDEEHKAGQIDIMSAIYANAHVTLVAAYGSGADEGLRPAWLSSIWDLDQAWLQDNQQKLKYNPNALKQQLLGCSQWMRRAWTLQELVFSRRAIIFTQHIILWECHCCTWHNAVAPADDQGECLTRFSVSAHGLQYSAWPDLKEYSELVASYSARDLTFQRDAKAAFTGVTNTLSKVFTAGFVFGLPVMFLDIALLWQPSYEIIEREQSLFPSWSWMGWKGEVDLREWQKGLDYLQSHTSQHIVLPLSSWKASSTESGPWVELRICRKKYRSLEVRDPNPHSGLRVDSS
jgi:hypothetical protein